MTQFWPNFKGRILGPCLKDADCYGDICQGNICPGDICSYMQYLSFLLVQFWPIFFGSWFLWTKIFLDKTSLDPHFYNANFFFQTQKRDVMRNFWRDIIYELGPWLAQSVRQNSSHNIVLLFGPIKGLVHRLCPSRNFAWHPSFIRPQSFYTRNSISPQNKNQTQFFFWPQIFSDLKFFQTQNFFGPKIATPETFMGASRK